MISMPGMMETVLNVGLTDPVAAALRAQYDDQFVNGCQRHLVSGLDLEWWGTGLTIERDAHRQLQRSITQVLESWNSPRAQAYRREHGIDERLGTAITIQQMVFGNRTDQGESGTGVVTSHNLESAEPGLYGNYLPSAQGHDLVSGEVTPESISTLTDRCPEHAATLIEALSVLTDEVGDPVEVEFTVEDGTLYFLQFRRAKLSPEATAIYLVREKHAGRISRDDVVETVSDEMVETLSQGVQLETSVDELPLISKLGSGAGITRGAASGSIASTEVEVRQCREEDVPYILVRRETTPDDFPLMLGAAGIVTAEGGETCHAAVVARHQGIPAVIGVGEETFTRLLTGRAVATITLDAQSGTIWNGTLPLSAPDYGREVALLLRWTGGQKGAARVINPTRCGEVLDVCQAINSFYIAEAMMTAVRDERLKKKIRAAQARVTGEYAETFSTYLALAVSSEVTYAGRNASGGEQELAQLRQRGYTLVHRDRWSRAVTPPIATELALRSVTDVAEYFAGCRAVFAQQSSTSYGGKKWADIAEAGLFFWDGTVDAAVFVDRVFDLQHNGGRVFNKHPMVEADDWAIGRQLDLKRLALEVGEKVTELRRIHRAVDNEIMALYEEGAKKGEWK
jgi:pyruvate,orthophosphate dikinase